MANLKEVLSFWGGTIVIGIVAFILKLAELIARGF